MTKTRTTAKAAPKRKWRKKRAILATTTRQNEYLHSIRRVKVPAIQTAMSAILCELAGKRVRMAQCGKGKLTRLIYIFAHV